MIITFLMTENVEPQYGMVTRMMTKHRTELLSTTKEDLRQLLANLKSKVAKLKCFFHWRRKSLNSNQLNSASKIDLVTYTAQAEGLVNMINHQTTKTD